MTLLLLRSIYFNHPACNLGTGVAGRLCGEVVPVFVNNKGTSDDIRDGKAGIVECHPCVAVIRQERRQVSAMERVSLIGWIIMHAGLIKRRCTVADFVDMHPEEAGAVRIFLVRKMCDFDLHDDAAGIGVIEGGVSEYRSEVAP